MLSFIKRKGAIMNERLLDLKESIIIKTAEIQKYYNEPLSISLSCVMQSVNQLLEDGQVKHLEELDMFLSNQLECEEIRKKAA